MSFYFIGKAPFFIGAKPKHAQIVRIMKLTAIIFLITTLHVCAAGYGQKVTLNLKNESMERVFTEIRTQTGLEFLYINTYMKKAKKVSINVKNEPLENVLKLCFKDQPFSYQIKEKVIVIIPIDKSEESNRIGYFQKKNIDIRGRVINLKQEPITNASVTLLGKNRSTVTNSDGFFSLNEIEDNSIIIISHIQYESQSIKVTSADIGNITLKIKISNLDELQVIAYGTTTKRFNTGNVSSIKSNEIERQPINNPLLALEGRVPGLVITQSTGFPGSGVSVRIQGQNTISSGIGNDPLIVIDGIPFNSRLLYTLSLVQGSSGNNTTNQANASAGSGNPLSFINPSTIESIEILKDADATSIYGSRAANGAILITTKKGKNGQTRANINMQTGWSKVSKYLDLLSTEEYLLARHEALTNDGVIIKPDDGNYDVNGVWESSRYTNWQKELLGKTARYTDLQGSISGGSQNIQFLVGVGYHKETTVLPGDFADQKASAHFNLNNSSSQQKFKFQFTASYLFDNNRLPNKDIVQLALQLPPNAPSLYNSDGQLNWAPLSNGNSSWNNPLSYLFNSYKNKTTNLVSSSVISYQIINGLDIKATLGYTNLYSDEMTLIPSKSFAPEVRVNSLRSSMFSNSSISTWIIEPHINYLRQLGKIRLEALLGTTIQNTSMNRREQDGSDYISDELLGSISFAASKIVTSGSSRYKYNAGFGRMNLTWNNKYIINLNGRRDGSSRFGAKNQFHNFWSVGGAWIFSDEPFSKNNFKFLSFGKLKGSYGTTGNDQIGDYKYLNLYSNVNTSNPYQASVGIVPNGLSNPFLAWEETRKTQIGVSLGFLKDRILLEGTFFSNKSSNQLLPYSLPIIAGFTTITQNFPATVRNYGWEIAASATILSNKIFTWSSSFNITIPKNKLLQFPDLNVSTYANRLIIGKPVTITKAYNLLGVDGTTGAYVFTDEQGNPTSTPSQTQIAINLDPTYYGGFQNNFQFKGFELSIFLQFVKQLGRNYYFGNYPGFFYSDGTTTMGNQPKYILERWQKVGDDKPIQKFSSSFNSIQPATYASASQNAYTDASYIRFKNVTISYQVPSVVKKKLRVQSAKVYLQGQNLLTLTNYKGLDPETRSSSSLPPLRVIVLGFQIFF